MDFIDTLDNNFRNNKFFHDFLVGCKKFQIEVFEQNTYFFEDEIYYKRVVQFSKRNAEKFYLTIFNTKNSFKDLETFKEVTNSFIRAITFFYDKTKIRKYLHKDIDQVLEYTFDKESIEDIYSFDVKLKNKSYKLYCSLHSI